jgi:RNA polymerase sigma-70 factor (ECF subfamily)
LKVRYDTPIEEATAVVYRAHRDELMRFATALVGPNDAPDVFSTALVKAFSSASFAGVSNKRAFLYRVVYNEANRFLRRKVRRPVVEAGGSHTEDWRMPALHPEVAAAVRDLSAQQRAAIYLTYWADLTPAQVAERLCVSEGSVRRHLARARARLREVLHD